MKSFSRLYCTGHKVIPVVLIIGIADGILSLFESHIVYIPWLSGESNVNVGTLCALLYTSIPIIFFRNEISRMESLTNRQWNLADFIMLLVLWALPWIFASLGISSSQFAYSACILMGLSLSVGKFLAVDTLALVLVVQLFAQTALWTALEGTPLYYLLFFFHSPSLAMEIVVSILAFLLSAVFVKGFKKNPR